MARARAEDAMPRLWVEEGETRLAPLISVAPVAPIDKVYTFTAPEALAARIRPGQRVVVPLGRRDRRTPAIVVHVERGPWTSTLKPVSEVLDTGGSLSEHLLELGQWLARYYCCPLGRTLAAMLPAAVRQQSGFVTVRRLRLVKPIEDFADERLGAKQRAVIECLSRAKGESKSAEVLAAAGASRATVRGLIQHGWIAEDVTKEAPEPADAGPAVAEPTFTLNPHQEAAVGRIVERTDEGKFRVVVLYGVSGSGKTEVYVHAIRKALAAGKQAILLVPEIALATQLVGRLARRFENVAILHSGLSDAQRCVADDAIRAGRKPVILGTRSAVFAPAPDIGLIVVDEEQETSYKNLQSPRFHVRDVAIKRAQLLGIPVVLGSATPSLETWHNLTRLDTYERVDLPDRVCDRQLPPVQIVDMGAGKATFSSSADGPKGAQPIAPALSPILRDELQRTLAAGQQTLLLLNRRGYAVWLQCPNCGQRIECPNCKTSLVFHQARGQAVCHYCHLRVTTPTHCPDPSCGAKLVRGGYGTERLEQELAASLPDARVRRADSDTMKRSGHYEKLVGDFEAGRFDVLVGTQMIAKGLDFPNVTLVGVIGADAAGGFADFRAGERLFQLIAQVAGRAGRADSPGRVIVQSAMPDWPALRFAANHDFLGFAESELRRREALAFPPFSRLARIVISGQRDRDAQTQIDQLTDRLRSMIEAGDIRGVELLGPTPCAMQRLRGMYRHELLIRARTADLLMRAMESARHSDMLKVKGVSMIIDVDPVSLT